MRVKQVYENRAIADEGERRAYFASKKDFVLQAFLATGRPLAEIEAALEERLLYLAIADQGSIPTRFKA